MKTLIESIKSNVGIGRYREGAKIVEDDIPCTVIKNDGKQVWLLSDVIAGTNKGKIAFVENKDICRANSVFYEWGSGGCDKNYFPNGWGYPIVDEWIHLKEEMYNHIGTNSFCNPAHTMWMKKGRKLLPYDIILKELHLYNRTFCGIRFAKIKTL